MPRSVALFERLMYASLALSLLVIGLDGTRMAALPEVQASGGIGFLIATGLFTVAILMLFIWLIARRRKNWARIVFVVLFVLGLIPFAQNFVNVLAANPLAAAVSALQMLLQVAALFFVFSSSARPWFKKDEPAHA